MTIFTAICDDERRIGSDLEHALVEIYGKLKDNYEIDVYITGEELCSKMENGAHYNLIFLDIEFTRNAINGVEVGRLIRETHQNNMVSIVYISWEKKYSMQLFDMRPLNFLIKPIEYKKVEQVVRTYIKISRDWSGDFTYKIGHDTYKVRIKDIVYIESVKRKLVIYLADSRTEEFYGTLKEIYQEQLKQYDFIFIHASFVVNYDYIAMVKYDKIFLTNSSTPLPISPRKRTEAREVYYAIMEKRRA